MGKSRTKKREAERKAAQKKQRNRLIAISVAVVAVLAVIGVILASRPIEIANLDEILARYDGIPTSQTDRGFYVLGNPEAPARMVEYSSFDCPSCERFHSEVTKEVIERVRSGEASFTYVPIFGTGGIPLGENAARAAICAGAQGQFFEYHDLLFQWQAQYVTTAFQARRLEAGAEVLGLDLDQFNTCLRSPETDEILDNAQAAFAQSGGTGTPTLTINDEIVSATLVAANGRIDQIMTTADPVPLVVEDTADDAAETPEVTEEAEATEDTEETAEDEVATEEPTEEAEESTEDSEDDS